MNEVEGSRLRRALPQIAAGLLVGCAGLLYVWSLPTPDALELGLLWLVVAAVFFASRLSRLARVLALVVAVYWLWSAVVPRLDVLAMSGALTWTTPDRLDAVVVTTLLLVLAGTGWRRPEVVVLGAAYLWVAAITLLQGVQPCVVPGDCGWLGALPRWVLDFRVGGLVVPALTAVVAGFLVMRLRHARHLDDRARTWLTMAAVLQGLPVLAMAGHQTMVQALSGGHLEGFQFGDDTASGQILLALDPGVTAASRLAVPLCLLGMAAGQRLRRAEAARVLVDIERPATPESVRDALRRALADPTLDVVFHVPDTGGYVDAAGRPVHPMAEDRSELPVRGSDGSVLAVVRIDPQRVGASTVVQSTLNAAALALENARLHAVVRAQLAEVRASRERLVEAGLAERRRLERDLHDGVQQRLLALNTTLARAGDTLGDPAAAQALDLARGELHLALRDLRDLARGLHPAVLSQSGLAPAVESLVERAGVPVTVEVAARRWPAAVEATAYFVVAEALANVTKHAGASTAHVRVVDGPGRVDIEVRDDGVGGADPGGSGLLGLRDRVTALAGTFRVDSLPARGTRILASLPCG
jgi:signal transduction histidine kinase